MADTSKSLSVTKHYIVVRNLASHYSHALTLTDGVKAACLFIDSGKATIFMAMKAGTLRDAWFKAQIDAFFFFFNSFLTSISYKLYHVFFQFTYG